MGEGLPDGGALTGGAAQSGAVLLRMKIGAGDDGWVMDRNAANTRRAGDKENSR